MRTLDESSVSWRSCDSDASQLSSRTNASFIFKKTTDRKKFALFFYRWRNTFQDNRILSNLRSMLMTNPPAIRTRTDKQAFTLIELLVVISIIAILASLGFPAVNGAIDSARKARAGSDVAQIATAVVAYEVEYGRLPTHTGTNVDLALMNTLTGNSTNNPRKIVFLEASPWKKGKGGTNSSGFCDPWDSNSVYRIALDTNYTNSVLAGTNSTNITKKVAVWNNPTGTDAEKKRRYVTSW
jgi:prepilin-type N-terminal cleavage/methylation domain-containing protein